MNAFESAFEALRKTVGDVEANRLLTAVETEKVTGSADWLHSVGEREAAYLLRTSDVPSQDGLNRLFERLGSPVQLDEAAELAEGGAELEAMRLQHPAPCRTPDSPDCTCPEKTDTPTP